MTDPSPQSQRQARVLLARNEDRRKQPRWVTDPRTGIERQVAGLLSGPPDDDANEGPTSGDLRRAREERRRLEQRIRDLRRGTA